MAIIAITTPTNRDMRHNDDVHSGRQAARNRRTSAFTPLYPRESRFDTVREECPHVISVRLAARSYLRSCILPSRTDILTRPAEQTSQCRKGHV